MDDIVLLLGIALVLVNAASNKQLVELWDIISNPSTAATDIPNTRSDLFILGGEILFVLILSFLAGTNKAIGSIAVALVVGLWIVWTLTHNPNLSGFFSALSGDVPGSKRSTHG